MSIESLSALLDGELRPQELERVLSALERDPELRSQFDRMIAARATLRGARVRPEVTGLAVRVREAIAREPGRPAARAARRVPRLLWVPLAAAAGMAGFAVLGMRPGSVAPAVATALPQAIPALDAAVAVPVSLVPVSAAVAADEPATPEARKQREEYLPMRRPRTETADAKAAPVDSAR